MDILTFIRRLVENTSEILIVTKTCSHTQLKLRSDDGWNILEILEHISITEAVILNLFSRPAEKIHQTESILGDKKLKKIMIDMRHQKFSSPEILKPRGAVQDILVFENKFLQQRELLKQGLQTGNIIIDNRVYKHPFLGEMTIKDWLSFILYHSQRHLEQIKDILDTYKRKNL